MNWFQRIFPPKISSQRRSKTDIPEGVWIQCADCLAAIYGAEYERNMRVCPRCGYHGKIPARVRISHFLDRDSEIKELGGDVAPNDPLNFKDVKRYRDRILEAKSKTGEADAMIVMLGKLKSIPIVAGALEFDFMGGSMGSVVGERFKIAVDTAIENSCAFVCFSSSGGARMQESLFSLMQMAKTVAKIDELQAQPLPFISVLTHPTTGGVAASFAMRGDVIIAEPRALIGFAGRRVIANTVREELPENFQSSEFLLENGAIDMIIERNQMRQEIIEILHMLMPDLRNTPLDSSDASISLENRPTEKKAALSVAS